jgi:RNA polymerase-binding protein DksA
MLKKGELDEIRGSLEQLRARLRGDVSQLADEALRRSRQDSSGNLSNMPIHMADVGTDNFEQDFTLSLLEREGGTLQRIEDALHRLEEGTFGLCQECGQVIPKPRLKAIPYATHCLDCARKQEGNG